MTTHTNLQLIQYKTIHRFHITQSKMFKMGLVDSEICSQCKLKNIDTYLHALWSCTPVYSFWTAITHELSLILGCEIPLSPLLCLLGDASDISLPSGYVNALLVSLTIAKKIIFQNWKTKENCHISHWKNILQNYISIEKTSAHSQNKISAFNDTWNKFTTYLVR